MKTLKELQFGRADIKTGNRHLFVAAKDLHNDVVVIVVLGRRIYLQ